MSQPSLRKNFIYRLMYDILTVITPFITTPYVSRVLGADGIGIYSYTNSIITYFTLFAALGTVSYGAREISQHRNDRAQTSKLFWEIELMTVMTTAASLMVWMAVILFSHEYRLYFLASTPYLLSTMFDISWYFTGHEKIKNIVIRNSVCKLMSVILLFVLVNDRNDVMIYIIINSAVSLFGNLSMWTYLPKMLVKVDMKSLRFGKHFKETLIYFVPAIASSVYTVLDKTLIGVITKNNYENGYYEQATKVLSIVKHLVFTSVNFVMGARISYLFAQKAYEEIKSRIVKSLGFILLLGYGAMFGIIGVAGSFVPVFFGEGYEPVVLLLRTMAPLIVIIGLSNCLGSQYYTPGGMRSKSAKYIIAGSVINLILNVVMIPFFSSAGAVIGSVFAEAAISFLYVRNSDGYMNFRIIVQKSWKRLAAGIPMMAMLLAMEKALHDTAPAVLLAVQVVSGGTLYAAVLFVLKDETLLMLCDMMLSRFKKKSA